MILMQTLKEVHQIILFGKNIFFKIIEILKRKDLKGTREKFYAFSISKKELPCETKLNK